jgi:hypothetical protein
VSRFTPELEEKKRPLMCATAVLSEENRKLAEDVD